MASHLPTATKRAERFVLLPLHVTGFKQPYFGFRVWLQ
jgi:hypothetical protein